MEQEIAAQVVGLGGSSDFSLWKLFLRADFVVKFVIILLIASSIFSWALIFDKFMLIHLHSIYLKTPATRNYSYSGIFIYVIYLLIIYFSIIYIFSRNNPNSTSWSIINLNITWSSDRFSVKCSRISWFHGFGDTRSEVAVPAVASGGGRWCSQPSSRASPSTWARPCLAARPYSVICPY